MGKLNQSLMLKTFAFVLFAGAACSTAPLLTVCLGMHGAALLFLDLNR